MNEVFFEEGKMFDGSSIAGWRRINKSDMILKPDPSTAVIDPFCHETTLNLRCDVIDPLTHESYERNPRAVAKRGEEYLKSTGIADTCYVGPEPEFFIFDDVRWQIGINGASYAVDSEEAAWNSNKRFEEGNLASPLSKGRLFSCAPR